MLVAWSCLDPFAPGEVFFFHGSRAVRKMEPQSSPVACLLPLRESLAVVSQPQVIISDPNV